MSPKHRGSLLPDGSFVEVSIGSIQADVWRPHGVRYRFAWIQGERCRVLFDNHFGKFDHYHVDGNEFAYEFNSIEQLISDFADQVRALRGFS